MSESKLHSIVLKDFKKHEYLALDFSDSVTVIRGPNYSGKSTVLEAIFFALFGTKAVPGGAEIITRKGSKSKAVVTLSLKMAGNDYTVVRTPSAASLIRTEDESTVATGHTAVNEEIGRLLGGDLKRTMTLALSTQGETASLLKMGASKLNSIIEDVSGVDYIDKLIERATKKASNAAAILDGLGEPESEDELQQALDNAEASHVLSDKEKIVLDKKISDARSDLEKVKAELTEAEQQNRKAEASNRKRADLNIRIQSIDVSIRRHEEQLSQIEKPNIALLSQNKGELENAFAASEEEYEKLKTLEHKQDRLTTWRDEVGDVYIEQAENMEPVKKLRADLAAIEAEHKTRIEEESKTKAEYRRLDNDRKNSVCSACNRPFDAEHLREVDIKLPEALAEWNAAKNALLAIELRLTDHKSAVNKLSRKLPPDDWEKQIEDNKKQIDELSAQISTLAFDKFEHANLEASLEEAKQAYTDGLSRAREYDRLAAAIEAEKAERARFVAELDMTKELAVTSLKILLEDQGRCLERHSSLSEERSALGTRLAQERAAIDALKLRLKTSVALASKRRDAESTKARFTRFARWLRDNKAAFLADTWAGILALVSEFTANVTSGFVEEVGRDPDGDFWFKELDQPEPLPIAAASGGQKSIAGAGLRIALASLLPAGLNFVVLDEPSADLNTEHAAALAGALRATNRQVILVTHREGEEFSSDAVVVLE